MLPALRSAVHLVPLPAWVQVHPIGKSSSTPVPRPVLFHQRRPVAPPLAAIPAPRLSPTVEAKAPVHLAHPK
jgi:hypothetical protein